MNESLSIEQFADFCDILIRFRNGKLPENQRDNNYAVAFIQALREVGLEITPIKEE